MGKQIEVKTNAPKKFYIWHVNDAAKIDEATGKSRMAIQNKLATMAYELFESVRVPDGEVEYRYKRAESADKATVADS